MLGGAARHVSWADAIIAHWLLPSAAIGAVVAARRGIPVVGVAHGGDVRLLERWPRLRRTLMARLSGLMAVSRDIAQPAPNARTV